MNVVSSNYIKMGRSNISLLVFSLFLAFEASSLDMLANYKFWKSASGKLIYDYSGNSRHTSLFYDYVLTDRGLCTNTRFSLSMMSYSYPVLNEYALSYWIFTTQYSELQSFSINYIGGYFIYQYSIRTNTINSQIYFNQNSSSAKNTNTSTSSLSGWNLHTLRLHVDPNTPGRLNFELFINLSPLYSDFYDAGTSLQLTFIRLWADQIDLNSFIILYEMWIYKQLVDISYQSSLLSSSSNCVCSYYCPTSPSPVCLPTYGRTMNKLGNECTDCLSNNLSCGTSMSCILKSKSGCEYGLYDIETYECLLYCPNNSCICSGIITGEFQNNTKFSCSCILGYKKVSDHPPACISNRCLTYHKAGYIYICDIAESGYLLDYLGIHIQCQTGFTLARSDPIVCVNTSICIDYHLSGGDYTCSGCTFGYKLDATGKCNLCDSKYINISANPFLCAMQIDNCVNHAYDGNNLICKACSEGYSINIHGECNQCDPNYEVAYEVPLICARRVENCSRYTSNGEDWKCEACITGYRLSIDRQCDECESGYIEVFKEPLICVLAIQYCDQLEHIGENWTCKKCEEGYQDSSNSGLCDECQSGYVRLDSENLVCKKAIEHCIQYELNSQDSKCSICETGYAVGSDFRCSICDTSYFNFSVDSLKCVMERLMCKEYELIDGLWECTECQTGYVLISDCEPEIPFCIDYIGYNNQYFCDKCQDGFKLDNGAICICEEGKYISLDNKCMECPDQCTRCKQDDNGKVGCLECEFEFILTETECKLDSSNKLHTTVLDQANQASQLIIVTSASISMVSLNINSILSIIGTIELLSFILLYNLNTTSRIKSILEGISVFNIIPNIFEYFMSNEDTLDIKRYKRVGINNEVFLINSGKIFTMIIIMIILIIPLKIIDKFTSRLHESSLIKKYVSKLLGILEWNFVIGYLIQVSIELTIYSLINIYHVSFHRIESVIGFSFSIIVLVRSILDSFINTSYITHTLSNQKV
jgi:hypothetical protein